MTQHTLLNMPSTAKRAIVVSIVQAMAAIIAFLSNTFESAAVLMLFALCGVAALVVTGILWGTSQTARKAMRAVFVLPAAVALVGVVCAIVTKVFGLSGNHVLNLSMSAADTPFWYTLLFDAAVTVTYAQSLLLFLFPAMITAAAFGGKRDRCCLRVSAAAHVIGMVVSVFVFAPHFRIPSWNDMSEHVPTWQWIGTEITLVQIVMLAVSAIFAVFAYFVGTEKKNGVGNSDA